MDKDITAADIDEMHRAKGWSAIGYQMFIRRTGLIEFGRHMDDVGAHVYGENGESVGICLAGGLFPDGSIGKEFADTFTSAQAISLKLCIDLARHAYPNASVEGHRDRYPDLDGDGIIESHEWMKACPTFGVREWLTKA